MLRKPNWKWTVAGVLLLATALRVVYVLVMPDLPPSEDAAHYFALAMHLSGTGSLSGTYGTITVLSDHSGQTQAALRSFGGPDAYWPPLYVFFLWALIRIYLLFTAASPTMPGLFLGMRIVVELLGVATVAMLGLIALRLFGRRVAMITLVIAAVFPPLIYLPQTLLSGSLFVPLVVAAVLMMVEYARGRRRSALILAGVLVGLATLTRSLGIFLVLPLLVAAWPQRRDAVGDRSWRSFLPVALAVCAVAVALTPWTVRNWVAFHHLVPLSLSTGNTVAGVYNAQAASMPALTWVSPRGDARLWWAYYGHANNQWAQSSALDSVALTYALGHPLYVLKVIYWNMRILLNIQPPAQSAGGPSPPTPLQVYTFWAVALLAILGGFTRRARAAPGWLWLVPAVMSASIVLTTVDSERFQVPIDPFVILLAALAVGGFLERRPGRRRELRTDDRFGSGPGNREHRLRGGEFAWFTDTGA